MDSKDADEEHRRSKDNGRGSFSSGSVLHVFTRGLQLPFKNLLFSGRCCGLLLV